MALAVGDDDGLEDGLQHGIGELKLHLPAAGLGIPQIAHAYSHAIQFAGNHTEIVAAVPFCAVLEIALRDFLCIAGQHLDRQQDHQDGAQGKQGRQNRKSNGDRRISRSQQGVPASEREPDGRSGE